jgi:hypothetical protein
MAGLNGRVRIKRLVLAILARLWLNYWIDLQERPSEALTDPLRDWHERKFISA